MNGKRSSELTRRNVVSAGLATATVGLTAGCSDLGTGGTDSSPTERASTADGRSMLAYVPLPDPRELSWDLYFLAASEPATLAELDMETDAADLEFVGSTARAHLETARISPAEVESLVTGARTADWSSPDGQVDVLSGTFDQDVVRHQLRDREFEPAGEHEGADLLAESDGSRAAAFDGEVLLMASEQSDPLRLVRSALSARAGSEQDRLVGARAGAGLLADRLNGEHMIVKLLLEGNQRRQHSDVVGDGFAYAFDPETVTLTAGLAFTSEAAAEAARDDGWVRASTDDMEWRNVELEWTGRTALVTAERPLAEFER